MLTIFPTPKMFLTELYGISNFAPSVPSFLCQDLLIYHYATPTGTTPHYATPTGTTPHKYANMPHPLYQHAPPPKKQQHE